MNKQLFLSYLAPLLISSTVFVSCHGPQTLTSDGKPVPYNVNTIYIPVTGDKTEAFMKFTNHLIMNGYSIESSNVKLLTLRTHYKNATQRGRDIATDVALTASIIDLDGETVIMLFGKARQGMRLPSSPDLGEFRISHFGGTGSIARVAWDELYRIASTYTKNLRFAKR